MKDGCLFSKVVKRNDDELAELIRRRRRQLTVHSYLYYRMDSPLIDDSEWQRMADELVVLQRDNPDLMKQEVYDDDFKDWDGSTGMHLSGTGYVRSLAEHLHKIYL